MQVETKYYTAYEGSIDDLKKLKVKKSVGEASWNKHLPIPLITGEIVSVHPDQSDVPTRYIKIIHSELKAISSFNKSDFEELEVL